MSDKQDKQFDPTPGRIRKAREEGNVFRSQEMTSVGLLLTGIAVIAIGTAPAFHALSALLADLLIAARTVDLTIASAPGIYGRAAATTALVTVPLMCVLLVTSIGFSLAQSGLNWTGKPLIPKPERISPLKGLKRIFSAQGMFTTGKSVLKVVLVGPLAYGFIKRRIPEILQLHGRPIVDALAQSASWILWLLVQLLLVLLLLSAIDFAFEKWRYKRDLKMDMREIKDEAKENEGDPQMRVRRRQLARQLLRPRLDHAVLKADVVVTNPTHYAVALRYDPLEAPAPMVLAKGIRKRALRIKMLAAEHGIPTVEDRPLARSLYRTVDEQQEIPGSLYPAVAAVLAEIYRKRRRAA